MERAERKLERERQREAERREKEEERIRQKEEKERQKEELRLQKEEERRQKEAEREAYRRAKEAEQTRIRAEKEAARRALEVKIARQTGRSRGGSRPALAARAYRADAIPNQSGTSRNPDGSLANSSKFANLRLPEQLPRVDGEEIPPYRPPTVAPPPPPPPERLDERHAAIEQRLADTSVEFRRDYKEKFEMSWIHHDSALEGVVYTFQELQTAIDPSITIVPDSSLQPVCEEIRRHKQAIDLTYEMAEKKRAPITLDHVKRIYLTLHPEEGDIKTVKYRKDIPQHRLYFHEYAPPDKIAYKVRQVIDWLNGPEPKKLRNPVRVAARAHYELLRVFPFPNDSGKVARLLMNLILLKSGYPPAIIHAAERQRYYEALKGNLSVIVRMVNDSITNGFQSVEKKLDEYETKKRSFPT